MKLYPKNSVGSIERYRQFSLLHCWVHLIFSRVSVFVAFYLRDVVIIVVNVLLCCSYKYLNFQSYHTSPDRPSAVTLGGMHSQHHTAYSHPDDRRTCVLFLLFVCCFSFRCDMTNEGGRRNGEIWKHIHSFVRPFHIEEKEKEPKYKKEKKNISNRNKNRKRKRETITNKIRAWQSR